MFEPLMNRAVAATIGLLLCACSLDADAERDGAEAASTPPPTPENVAHGPGADFAVGAGEAYPGLDAESHLRSVRQLTFDGENAEAYFAFDGTRLVYQRTPADGGCDQIYELDLATGAERLVSTGNGRTTCSYFYPDGETILFSSTHLAGDACPAPADYGRGYVWPVYEAYDIFVTDGEGAFTRLTETPGYDAEATVSPVGDRIVFTSVRDGDLDLYSMALDGSDVRRLTDRPGYDGGAFYSPDGSQIVWRAHYPEGEDELEDYRGLLADGLIRPSRLELWVADADGSNPRQLTQNGAANFGPYWHPSGEWIVFSSNVHDPQGRDFDLYGVSVDGGEPWRITRTDGFDGFPVFSPDGRFLVWGSNRNPAHEGNTNVFIAEWVD
jgi:TolB protein